MMFTASVAAFDLVGQQAYSASKGGQGMTLLMARDLAQHGIRSAPWRPAWLRC